jgi:hypothetical protein
MLSGWLSCQDTVVVCSGVTIQVLASRSHIGSRKRMFVLLDLIADGYVLGQLLTTTCRLPSSRSMLPFYKQPSSTGL